MTVWVNQKPKKKLASKGKSTPWCRSLGSCGGSPCKAAHRTNDCRSSDLPHSRQGQ